MPREIINLRTSWIVLVDDNKTILQLIPYVYNTINNKIAKQEKRRKLKLFLGLLLLLFLFFF